MTIEEINYFVSVSCKHLEIEKPKTIKIRKDIKGSLCFYSTKEICFPEVFLQNVHSEGFIIWQILHEVCHLLEPKHNDYFISLEEKLCKFWGIRLERKSVYPKNIYFNGLLVFSRE